MIMNEKNMNENVKSLVVCGVGKQENSTMKFTAKNRPRYLFVRNPRGNLDLDRDPDWLSTGSQSIVCV